MDSSANFGRHQQLQAQAVAASSSSTTSSSPSAHPNNIPSSNYYGSQNFTLYNEINPTSSELSFEWNNHSGCFTSSSAPTSIKDEADDINSSSTSSDPFPRFTHMLITSSPADDTSSSSSSARDHNNNNTAAFPLFLGGGGGGGGIPGLMTHPSVYGNAPSSLIYPSINVSNLIQAAPMDDMMSLQAMDLFTSSSSRFGHLLGETANPYGGGVDLHHYPTPQYSTPTTATATTKVSSSSTEAKRCSSGSSSNDATAGKLQATTATASNKKSRLEQPRASCPPFKVRKEKLGDRIASLQQLVAPFGKTDTASVLMEAIGYIKFLQNQVETLSVPYMKSTRNKPARPNHFQMAESGNGGEGSCRDLRSRGLCLVPLSCMSYVASIDSGSCSGGPMWPPPPPNFGGGT